MWWIRAVSAIIGGSDGKESAWNAGDLGSIPGFGKISWRREWLLQYSCLENSMDKGAGWATIHGITRSHTWLRDYRTHTLPLLVCTIKSFGLLQLISFKICYRLIFHMKKNSIPTYFDKLCSILGFSYL